MRPYTRPHPLRRCPNNSDPETENPPVWHNSIPLKAEHGCLQFPAHDASPEKRVVYFRNDGTRIELDVPRNEIGIGVWIEWLGGYLLRNDVISGWRATVGGRLYDDQVVPLMMPDGRLLSIPMNEWDLSNVRPTRAGMVVTTLKGTAGIYLWKADERILIAEGYVKPRYLEVSPDGCHVAYYWNKLYAADNTIRLRVINVCRGMGIPADANPFNW